MDRKVCDSCGKQYGYNNYDFSVWMPPEFLERESTADSKEHHIHLNGKIHGTYGFSHAGMSEIGHFDVDLCPSCYKMVFDKASKEVKKLAEEYLKSLEKSDG